MRPGFVALLGPAAAESTVRDLWQATGEGVFAALALLARDGFAGLPPFALVSVDKRRVHAALRGDVEVVVDLDGRLETLRSGEVSTWTERVLDGVGSVAVQVDARARGRPEPAGRRRRRARRRASGSPWPSPTRRSRSVEEIDVVPAQVVEPVEHEPRTPSRRPSCSRRPPTSRWSSCAEPEPGRRPMPTDRTPTPCRSCPCRRARRPVGCRRGGGGVPVGLGVRREARHGRPDRRRCPARRSTTTTA